MSSEVREGVRRGRPALDEVQQHSVQVGQREAGRGQAPDAHAAPDAQCGEAESDRRQEREDNPRVDFFSSSTLSSTMTKNACARRCAKNDNPKTSFLRWRC